jgi:DNA-binding NarL/FixJ family response regulator
MARLLLADRQPLLNDALEALLTCDGAHEVLARCTPQDDIPQEVHCRRPDVLLLDADIAMSGQPTVLERSLAARPGLKVLLLMLDMDVELLLDGMDAGAVGVVLKTSWPSTVRTAVERAFGGEVFVPRATLPKVFRQLDAQHRAGASLVHRLSAREREVLALLGQGRSNESIGEALFISPHTVRTHIQNILEKLGFHSRLEAAAFAMERASELPTALRGAPKGTG